MRGFLASVVRKKLGLNLVSTPTDQGRIYRILDKKYGFDEFNDWFFAGGARKLGQGLFRWGDRTIIDGIMVNGTARLVGWLAGLARRLQSGYVYHYAFTMIIGVFALLTLWYSRI